MCLSQSQGKGWNRAKFTLGVPPLPEVCTEVYLCVSLRDSKRGGGGIEQNSPWVSLLYLRFVLRFIVCLSQRQGEG